MLGNSSIAVVALDRQGRLDQVLEFLRVAVAGRIEDPVEGWPDDPRLQVEVLTADRFLDLLPAASRLWSVCPAPCNR